MFSALSPEKKERNKRLLGSVDTNFLIGIHTVNVREMYNLHQKSALSYNRTFIHNFKRSIL